jgi:hypothetical protein
MTLGFIRAVIVYFVAEIGDIGRPRPDDGVILCGGCMHL